MNIKCPKCMVELKVRSDLCVIYNSMIYECSSCLKKYRDLYSTNIGAKEGTEVVTIMDIENGKMFDIERTIEEEYLDSE